MLDFIKNFISKLLNGTSDEQSDKTQESESLVRQWQFADYVPRIPEIILYIRRQREIPRRQLELTLIDKEDEPAWRIKGILRNLMKDPQVMYLGYREKSEYGGVADAGAVTLYLFSKNADTQIPLASPDIETLTGVVHSLNYNYTLGDLVPKTELEKMPGNLVLDLNLWENQLDRFSKIWV